MPQESPSIFLAPAAESDFEALVAIRIEAMRESLERIGRFDAGRARERFRSSFSPERTRHIVAGTETAGFVVTKPQEQYLLLDHLYLLPTHQGRGIGSKVLQLVFAEAESLRLPVKVGALRESEANHFYAHHGFQFVEQGEFDNYYIRPARSAP